MARPQLAADIGETHFPVPPTAPDDCRRPEPIRRLIEKLCGPSKPRLKAADCSAHLDKIGP